ncbi:WW domain-binding protein 11-like [Schistocerca americana]|uniref:WW domain-binding protein 11-like n=1 Tax=Schistocerca americana TaxID=7009 RepID=UPI001F4F893D|nr:WW domain-binding protein 11-like [Schistocerca americana]
MLKWLSGARPKGPQPAEVVTDDPLATIHVAAGGKLDGPLEIYAVSRVNPIFDEGGGSADRRGGGRCDRGGSSGYGSSGSGGGSGGGSGARSPCASSSGGESPKQSAPPTPEQASPTRTPATMPAGRCSSLQTRSPAPPRHACPPPASPPPPLPQARPPPPDTPAPPPPGGSGCSRLCPIPEGWPVGVPRPIWPPKHLDALYAALAKHTEHEPAAAVAAAAAVTARDHASDTASSSASSGFGDDHPPCLSTRLVCGERCSAKSMSSSREKLLSARPDAGAGVGVGGVCRPHINHSPLELTPGLVHVQRKTGERDVEQPRSGAPKPDFTLDKAAAERLMRNIQKAKRRRCVCHAATSFLGLAVFLLSVMLVSLAMTGGRRYFGSL